MKYRSFALAAAIALASPVIACFGDWDSGDVIVLPNANDHISDGATAQDKDLWDRTEFARAMGVSSTILHSWNTDDSDQDGRVEVSRRVDGQIILISASMNYDRFTNGSDEHTYKISGQTSIEVGDFLRFVPGDMMSPAHTVWVDDTVVDPIRDQTSTVLLGFEKP